MQKYRWHVVEDTGYAFDVEASNVVAAAQKANISSLSQIVVLRRMEPLTEKNEARWWDAIASASPPVFAKEGAIQ